METFAGPSAEWQGTVNSLPLQSAQKPILIAHPDRFTNADYHKLNGVDRDQAYREILEMVRLGVVTPSGTTGRGKVWLVAKEYARNGNAKYAFEPAHIHEPLVGLEEKVTALRSHFVRRPFMKNSDYRKLFDLKRNTACRELRRLVGDGYLTKEGKHRGTRYTPGPLLDEVD
jgi:predicted HTH transcriptional regulator